MKKTNAKTKKHQKSRTRSVLKRKIRKQKKFAKIREKKETQSNGFKRKQKNLKKFLKDKRFRSNPERKKFIKNFYKPHDFANDEVTHTLIGQLGLEYDIDAFVKFSEKIIDAESSQTSLDFNAATRIWPSGIVMVMSFVEWVKLTSSNYAGVSSSDSATMQVNDYLKHCGFYDYVQRDSRHIGPSKYSNTDVVKIRVESSQKNTKERQYEILDLVKKYGILNSENLERFDCSILSEIFVNVTEHGVTANVSGWFVLAQYHPTTGIISICIADNGIGIKNSLSTGFQKDEIQKLVSSTDDADFIETALTSFVSGALDSSDIQKKHFGLAMRLSNGKKRGMGLKRVVKACKEIGLRLTLCSHGGCISINETGSIDYKKTMAKRCFAGTLYHLTIPAKKELISAY